MLIINFQKKCTYGERAFLGLRVGRGKVVGSSAVYFRSVPSPSSFLTAERNGLMFARGRGRERAREDDIISSSLSF